MSNEKDTKQKKTMYVPDEEILNYNKNKKKDELPDEIKEVDAVALSIDDEIADATVTEEITEVVDTSTVAVKDKKQKRATKDKKPNILSRIACRLIPMKSDNKKTVIIKLVGIIAAIALIVSTAYLGVYFGDLGIQDGKINNVRNNYDLNRNDYTKNDDNQFSKFDVLKAQNPDIVGWITISNTQVNNPVYQTTDNEFYVTHDMDKKPNSYGALTLDYRCNIDPKALTQNQIIYGHNMRFGAMFGTLDEYRDIEFAKQNTLISFDSLYEQRTYKIFAIMVVNDFVDNTFGYSYTAYRSVFTGDSDFLEWVDRSKQRSLYDFPVDVVAEDEVITLSTCCYDYDNARFVVLGRLVREGEEATVDPAGIVKNADVIYSKEYYNKKKLPIPQLTSSNATTSTSSGSK